MKSIYLYIIVFVSFFASLKAQDSIQKSNLQASFSLQYGKFLGTNDYLKELKHRNFVGASAEITVQTDGSKEWHRRFGRPYYGGGIVGFDYLKNNNMGSPFAVYGTFGGAIKETPTHSWNYETSGGFAFNWTPYDLKKGYNNQTFGSSVSIYINLGANYKYYLGKHFDLGLGMNFNHFSNGALKLPNKGMNTFSPKLSLTYHFDEREFAPKDTLSAFDKYSTLDVNVFGGVRHSIFYGKDPGFEDFDVDMIRKFEGKYHQNWGLETVYHRQVTYKSSLGLGIGLMYDEDYNNKFYQDQDGVIQSTKRFEREQLLLNIFPSYRLSISKFAVQIQPGFYIFRKTIDRRYDKTFFYQRVGFQYTIGKNFLIGIGLRSFKFHKADYIEWRLGYRIFNKKVNNF
ncbi:acyloxyacyl hydrolase [Chryseobacterium taihuense]|uniref:Lipid A 3-O-deacylase (PagL) n=1 Tax=Chryseobacterium taihuense TaxID=1141221 RepID=A0ABY0R3A8_9FLAO|nr:acyloxyacyl hydrolase [Chryseobacterium taihuense]SDM34258.1 Lipid A 3-O-deacylase (PagL) [Chryseobacterium taihuense]